jgi:outer membrane protein TolC
MTPAISTALALVLALAAPQPQPNAPTTPATPPAAQAQPALPAAPPTVITLDEALQIAAAQNLDLRAAKARLRQANEISWKAWSAYLPQLTVSGSYTHNQREASITLPTSYEIRDFGEPQGGPPANPLLPPSPNNSYPTNFGLVPSGFVEAVLQKQDQLGAQVDLTQMIFSPALVFGIRQAYAGEEAAKAGIDIQQRDILFGVAQAYYGVTSFKRNVQISEQLLQIQQRQERDARVRFQAGTIAKVGLLRAEIDRARAEQDLKRASNAFESARLGLALLLNRPVDFDVADPPEPQLPANPAELEDAAARDRSEVKAARASVDQARAGRNAAAARYLPNVSAFGRYQIANVSGFTGEKDQWAVGLQGQWFIFDGGRRESDIREGNAKIDEAIANAAATEQRVRNEVRQGLLDLDSARANAAKAKEQRDLAAENQRLVDVSYRAGAATAVEQADATAQLRNAELAQQAETLAAQLAALRVLRVAGAELR